MTGEDLEKEFSIIDLHYNNKGNSANIFISFFEDNKSKDMVEKEYIDIGLKNKDEIILVKVVSDFAINMALNNFESLGNSTMVVDCYQCLDKKNLYTSIHAYQSMLRKNSNINLHILAEKSDIREYFSGTDLWEFKTKSITYPKDVLPSYKLKEKLEEQLPVSNIIKKAKI